MSNVKDVDVECGPRCDIDAGVDDHSLFLIGLAERLCRGDIVGDRIVHKSHVALHLLVVIDPGRQGRWKLNEETGLGSQCCTNRN